jgi:hypothetical protein
MRARLPTLAFLLVFTLALPALAADLFAVTGVPVDVSAGSAAEARNQALATGQRQALRAMLERLTLREDHARLPAINEALVNQTVQGFEIADERTSATRYIARLSVSFRAAEIRGVLRRAGIPHSETRSPPLVVLPVLHTGERAELWSDPNPWREAWNARAPGDGLVPFTMPLGDLGDLQAIDVDKAVAGDEAALKAIAARHGSGDVLVAEATPSGQEVTVAMHHYAGETRHTIDVFALEGPADAGASYGGAVREAMARFEDAWKRETMIQHDRVAALAVSVPLGGIADWVKVRQRLGEAAEVSGYEINALTARQANLTLNYFGDPRRLRAALAARQLELVEADGFWTLRLPKTAAAPAP